MASMLCLYASEPATAVTDSIRFSGCLSVHPIFVNTTSQERLEGISLNLAKIST